MKEEVEMATHAKVVSDSNASTSNGDDNASAEDGNSGRTRKWFRL